VNINKVITSLACWKSLKTTQIWADNITFKQKQRIYEILKWEMNQLQTSLPKPCFIWAKTKEVLTRVLHIQLKHQGIH